jgi:ubiquinone/menaquinone biosynthesis C-methylase UbiE
VCSLPYKDNLFHLLVDKGTMDALIKNPKHGRGDASSMLHEAERVLQSGGMFLQVTDEDPDSRLLFLEKHSPKSCSWNVSVLADVGPTDRDCFVYTFFKP